jgi:hypothetical protein
MNWRSSVAGGGNPGSGDATTFASWALLNGVTGVNEDRDGDGVGAGFEYLAGTDPNDRASGAPPEAVLVTDGSDDYLVIRFMRQPGRDEASVEVRRSVDLQSWVGGAGEVEFLGNVRHPDGSETLSFRSLTPLVDAPVQFLRLEMVVGP